MKFILSFTLLIISACTSQSIYKPASGSGFGYTDTVLGENVYRVQFKAFSERKSADYALLRAAELTHERGYDWFVVIKRDILEEEKEHPFPSNIGEGTSFTQNCGLLHCRTTINPSPAAAIDNSNFHSVNATTSILDIRFGKGIRPSSRESDGSNTQKNINESYSALETIERLKAKLK